MALTYIEKLEESTPSASELLAKCNEYYRKKLWHQITDVIEQIVKTRPQGLDLLEFQEKFIREFRDRLNLLRYAAIIVNISKLYKSDIGIPLCEHALKAVEDKNAKLLLQCQIAYFELEKDWIQCKNSLEEIYSVIDKQIRIPSSEVLAHYHFVCACLWKNRNNPEKFYENAMKYIGYAGIDKVENLDKWATDIALSSLISPNFYDFGELSLHPMMKSLQKHDNEWILNIVKAYINANLKDYHDVMSQYEKQIDSENLLKNNIQIMNEKIKLLSLVRLSFDKPSYSRILTFKEIANVIKCEIDYAEHIVMRAMSLKLIEGSIDGIEETITITYVKPRILDMNEIENMTKKIDGWCQQIEQTHDDIEPTVLKLFN